jgi:uncharacterized lipoprotein YmbA
MRVTYFRLVGMGIFLIISPMVLQGCFGKGTQDPTKYYLLQPIASSATGEHRGEKDGGFSLGVGPVRLREYLDRPQIVSRTGENEIHISRFHSWGEPLTENFSATLASNLSILLETDRLALWPWGRKIEHVDFQIMVDVSRFDGVLGGQAVLSARWYVFSYQEGMKTKGVTPRKSTFTTPAEGDSYEALVTAMSKTLEKLSREVAEAIRAKAQ